MVLEIPRCCELFPTAQLRAHKGFFTIVSSHVHLQPLQDIETFSTAFCWAGEGTVIPGKQQNGCFITSYCNVFFMNALIKKKPETLKPKFIISENEETQPK